MKEGITLDVKLLCGATEMDFEAKIDTGASNCIFQRIHGEYLGLEVESGKLTNFGTAAGSFLAYGHELTLEFLKIQTVSTVFFAADDNFSRNVLGRQGWLDRVRLGLIDYEGQLYLSANSDE